MQEVAGSGKVVAVVGSAAAAAPAAVANNNKPSLLARHGAAGTENAAAAPSTDADDARSRCTSSIKQVLLARSNARTGHPPSGQLPAGAWPGARAGWPAARVHPVSLRFMHADA